MRRALFTFLSAVALIATGVVGAVAVGGTGTVDPPPRIAFLANGIVPADALAAGGIAGQLGAPLFTTPADSLNDDAKEGLVAYDPDLIIVLGGPVAINDSVVTALSQATGLAVTTAEDPDDGIVRAAGGDRFATARAVAELLAAYSPAYLPVDATALGAVDADQLDGKDATDFAASSQSCEADEVVVSIDATGTILCAPDNADGGDADTLDGFEAGDLSVGADVQTTSLVDQPAVTLGTADDKVILSLDITPIDECGDGTTMHRYLAMADGDAQANAADTIARHSISLDDPAVDTNDDSFRGYSISSSEEPLIGAWATHTVLEVTPGAHTIRLMGDTIAGGATVFRASLTLQHLGWSCGMARSATPRPRVSPNANDAVRG